MSIGLEKHVGLLVEPLHGHRARILSGVARWIHTHPGWSVAVFDGEPAELVQPAKRWEGDGILCTLTTDELKAAVDERDIPVVNVSGHASNHRTVSVVSDHDACAALAANYFRDRGFAHFCFVGNRKSATASSLGQAFQQQCGSPVVFYEAALGEEEELAAWLKEQTRPLAVLADSDHQAASVLEACHLAALGVPDEVAVLGVGNEAHLCDLCTPALSSIDCDLEARGYAAAATLFQLMEGTSPDEDPVRIAPVGIVTRRSTDTYAFGDPDLSSALRFIHQNAHQSIKVMDVLTATNISRRSLENRFRRYFSRSLHEEIWRVHFDLAKKLLTTTDLRLQEVAERSGFRTASALANLFKQKTGLTPRSYRAEHRQSAYQ